MWLNKHLVSALPLVITRRAFANFAIVAILSFQAVLDLADCIQYLSTSVMAVTLGGNGDV